MTGKIITEATKADYGFGRFSLFSNDIGSMPDFSAMSGAVKTVYGYAKRHSSEFSTDILVISLDEFKKLTMGLYNLEKRNNYD